MLSPYRMSWVALFVALIICVSSFQNFNIASAGIWQNPKPLTIERKPNSGGSYYSGKGGALPYDDVREEMLYLLNQYRISKGLAPVRPSTALSQAAEQLSRRLAELGAIDRTGED